MNITDDRRDAYESFLSTEGPPIVRNNNRIRSSNVFASGPTARAPVYMPITYAWLNDSVPAVFGDILANMDVLTIP